MTGNTAAIGVAALQIGRCVVVVRNLVDEDATALLQEITAGRVALVLLGFVPLMKGGDDPAIITAWKRVAALEPSWERCANYWDAAKVFAELARRKTIWHRELQGWGEMRSALVEEWKAEGREEGRINEAREVLLEQGTERFQTQPQEVVRSLTAITDRTELRRLTLRLLRVRSGDELLAS